MHMLCTTENKRALQHAKLELKKSKRKDYYKILGVRKDASEDEIKKAYKKRALVHHPGIAPLANSTLENSRLEAISRAGVYCHSQTVAPVHVHPTKTLRARIDRLLTHLPIIKGKLFHMLHHSKIKQTDINHKVMLESRCHWGCVSLDRSTLW